MWRFIATFCLLLLATSNAYAWRNGYQAPTLTTGSAQINVVDNPTSYAFLNVMASYGMTATGANAGDPGLITADNLPKDGTLPNSILGNSPFPTFDSGYLGQWQVSWSGTGAFKFRDYGTSGSALTINSCSGTCAQTTSNTTISGTNVSVTLTLGALHQQINLDFPTGFTYSGMSSLRFCRVGNATPDDCTRLASGQYINRDFSNAVAGLHPKTIRPMAWSGVNVGNTNYPSKRSYSAPVTSINFLFARWIGPAVWAGSTVDSGTDTFVSPTFTDAPASWPVSNSGLSVTWQTLFTTTNSTTTPTVTITGVTGAKTLVSNSGAPLAAGDIKTDRASTLVYDPLLDKVLYTPRGVSGVVPIEAQVELANLVNANLWFNFAELADDTTVASYTAYARDNLNNGFYTEYMNEVWNFSLGPMTSWAAARGNKLGFASGRDFMDWHGLRTWQINTIVGSTWSPRSSSLLHRVIASQASASNAINQQTYRLNGTDLNAGTFPLYSAYTGGVSHNTYPNRPIDNSDVIAYATYFFGAIMTQSGAFGGTYAAGDLADCSVAGTNSGGIICAGKNFTLGTVGSLDAANQWIDNDLRQGTQNGVMPSSTLGAFACKSSGACNAAPSGNASIYWTWEQIAASYDASGRAVALTVEAYEGGNQATWPTAANCTTMGIDTALGGAAACTATLQAMLTAYKNSSYASALVVSQFKQFVGSDATSPTFGFLAHSKTPSWFQMQGPIAQNSPWGMMPGSIYVTPYFQFYNGFAAFN